ncbi:phosphotransferase enzyme family protein [Acidovorax lacteus]|uniref:Aminoglycoside phosphotransferase domain-containing protein n=1 Tax=Acidovorax lacteus TaxID=1924988 RepID=A0ABP8LH59_9BURK
MIQLDADSIAQTTPTARAMARLVDAHWALGPVQHCTLMRRGFNHVYGLQWADGRRAIARLSAARPRGPANVDYEAALLGHLQRRGIRVAAPLPTAAETSSVNVTLPEGTRPLMLFEHLDGEPPGDDLSDWTHSGRALAALHTAGQDYTGPPSRYTLEPGCMLHTALAQLRKTPVMDDALWHGLSEVAAQVRERLGSAEGLGRVHAHGDFHGSNHFMVTGLQGAREVAFFDFDDAGPGLLAYELGVLLWSLLPRRTDVPLAAPLQARWRHYLAGYRSVAPLAPADIAAMAPSLVLRQFWTMAEYAGRVDVWGTEAMPAHWLRKQVPLMQHWLTLDVEGDLSAPVAAAASAR